MIQPILTTLSNGLRVLVIPIRNRKTVYFDFVVETGSRWETEKEKGLSHLTEHVISDRILKTLPKDSWDNHYIAMDFEATTYDRRTNFECTTHKKDLNKGISFISNCLHLNGVTEKDVQHEKERIIMELREQKNDPFMRHAERCRTFVFGTYPLSIFPGGTEQSVQKKSLNDVTHYFQTHHTPDRMLLTIAGDIQPSTVIKQVKKSFGSLKGKTSSIIKPPKQISGRKDEICKGSASITYSWLLPQIRIQENVELEFVMNVLENYLRKTVQKKLSLYSISTDVTTYKDFSWVTIDSVSDGKRLKEYEKILSKSLKAFPSLFTQKRFKKVINERCIDLELSEDSIHSIANSAAWYLMTFGKPITPSDQANILKKIQRKDVINIYKRILKMKPAIIVSNV
ncbi:MAG: pitrilysin family protein [Patescibacteria group bacterium]